MNTGLATDDYPFIGYIQPVQMERNGDAVLQGRALRGCPPRQHDDPATIDQYTDIVAKVLDTLFVTLGYFSAVLQRIDLEGSDDVVSLQPQAIGNSREYIDVETGFAVDWASQIIESCVLVPAWLVLHVYHLSIM